MSIHTSHTCLAEIVREARVRFVVAHPTIYTRSSDFVVPSLTGKPEGTLVKMSIRWNGSKRYLMNASVYEGTAETFAEQFKVELERERLAFGIRFPIENKKFEDSGLTNFVNVPKNDSKVEAEAPRIKVSDEEIPLTGGRWVGKIWIENADYAMFQSMIALSEFETANILLIGPSGCGKTSIPEAIAKEKGMGYLRMNCAAVRDPEEWFGYREAVKGSTEFVATEFTNKVREGNCIIVLDELNRIEPWLHNSLLPLLDHDGATTIHNERIVKGKNVIFVATINRGARFTGTFMLDAAVLNRFGATMYANYLSKALEVKLLTNRTSIDGDTARKIVEVVTALRDFANRNELDVDVSTRSSLKIASLMSAGKLTLEHVVRYVILNLIDDQGLLKNAIDVVSPILKA